MTLNSNALLFYQNEANVCRERIAKFRRERNLLAIVRLVFFTGSVVSFVEGLRGPIAFLYVSLLFMVVFLVLVGVSLKVNGKLRFFKRLLLLNESEAKQLRHEKNLFTFRGDEAITADVRSQDLDLFGETGLFPWLDRTITKQGGVNLAKRLLGSGSSFDDYTKEQAAVKEMATYGAWRQRFITIREWDKPLDSAVLKDWLSADESNYRLPTVWMFLRYLVPLFSGVLLLLVIIELLPVWLLFAWILVNFMMLSVISRRLLKIHTQLTNYFHHVQSYRRVIQHIRRQSFSSKILFPLQNQLTHKAQKCFGGLERILAAFDNRLNIIVSVVLNGLFLWDIQCVSRLHSWHKDNKSNAQKYLYMIETFDMYVSLGNFAFNHPDYTYPLENPQFALQATGIGHPLIPYDERVSNDFALKPRHIALVTGANMAGKSTFLRTLGVNYLLANAGLPVCAQLFQFTPGCLLTSLRTQDSLDKHESYFLAELRGLKNILEHVKTRQAHLFLIDEMLKGTNSKDKLEGSMAVVRNLIAHGGTGIIATHDLPVTQLSEEFQDQVHNYCFEIRLIDTDMTFDYVLQKGVTQNMNASFLLRNMGLVEEKFFNKSKK